MKVLSGILHWRCTVRIPSALNILVPCGKRGRAVKCANGSTGDPAAISIRAVQEGSILS